MKILLKKKKMSILRNYQIKSNYDTSLESIGTISKGEKDNLSNEPQKELLSSKTDPKPILNKKENLSQVNNYIENTKGKPIIKTEEIENVWKQNNPESLRMKSTTDEDSNKGNNVGKKENQSKISRNEAYDQRPKTSLKIEDLVENDRLRKTEEKKEDKINLSMIDEKKLLNQKRSKIVSKYKMRNSLISIIIP
jgi:hypothetical protein